MVKKPVLTWWTYGDSPFVLAPPIAVAIANDGLIWVADISNRFVLFTEDGNAIESWGSSGRAPGEFRFKTSTDELACILFAPDGSFYVSDFGNHRVQAFAEDRTLIAVWGSEGDGDGEFLAVGPMALDDDGSILVSDGGRNDIQRFDADGRFIERFDAADTEDGPLKVPVGIGIDATRRLYVAEFGAQRIRVFDETLAQVGTTSNGGPRVPSLSAMSSIALTSNGTLFACDSGNRQVVIFDSSLMFVSSWGSPFEEGNLLDPSGIAISPGGSIYVVDSSLFKLLRFDFSATSDPDLAVVSSSCHSPTDQMPIRHFGVYQMCMNG